MKESVVIECLIITRTTTAVIDIDGSSLCVEEMVFGVIYVQGGGYRGIPLLK